MKNFSRRKFLLLSGGIIGAALVPAAVWKLWECRGADAAGQATGKVLRAAGQSFDVKGADVQYLRQLITPDITSSRTVMWQSQGSEQGLLEYRVAGETEIHKLYSDKTQFKTYDKGLINLHGVILADLQPDTVYEYRVGRDGVMTDWCHLSTAGGSDFTVLLFPDSQCSANYNVWKETAQAAWQMNPDARFFINMGDLVDNGQQYSQWQAWLDGAGGLLEQIPFAPVCGNHEDYSLDWKMAEPDTYLQLFQLPDNGLKEYSELFYSYDAGDVHFVVLDSQQSELAEFKPDLFQAEYEWLERDLAKTAKKWKIVMLHKHVFDYMKHTGITELGRFFMPLFDKYGVDIVFTAHLHTYHRTRPLYNGVPAAKGTVYISTGRAGDMAWPGYFPAQPGIDVEECDELTEPNYIALHISENELWVECCLPDGRTVDNVKLMK